MNKMRPPRKRSVNWEYKNKDFQQIDQNIEFQLYLLADPAQLSRQFIEEVPFFWVHHKLKKDRQFEIYLNQLSNQINVTGFPYVDNMLQTIDKLNGNFKIICQIKDLDRIFQFHRQNKKLLSIYIFDLQLKNKTINSRSKKIEIKLDQYKILKKVLQRKQLQKNQTQIFTNATRITNWDISQVNKSRLVLKTLLVSKNDKKGKQDFIKLATFVTQQHTQISQYQSKYLLNSSPQEAIKWYTKQSFYHKLVNNTLKAGKGNPLFLSYIRFPVKELYNSIKSLYRTKKLYLKQFQCYRGGRINQTQLQYFIKNKNGFIQMQGFLSCSKSKQQITKFVSNCVFKIKVNNLQRDIEWDHGYCFLDTELLTQFTAQQEVLFNIFSVMQIKDVVKQRYNGNQVDVIILQYGSLAAQLYKKKNKLQISNHQKRCISNFEALKPYYDSITNQGDCFKFFDQFKLAQQYFLKMLKHYQNHKTQNILKIFAINLNLGQIYLNLSQFNKAKQSFLKNKDIIQSKYKNIDIDIYSQASVYNGLGIVYKKLNKMVESKANYLKTIQLIQKIKNENCKKLLPSVYNNLAGIFLQQFQQKQALNYYSKALSLVQNQNNQIAATTFYNIGIVHLQRQDFKLAIKNLSNSLQIYILNFGTHKDTGNTHFKLGQAFLKNNQTFVANKHFDSALDIYKQLYSPFDQKYIKFKREVQSLKSSKKKQYERGSSSLDNHKISDVLGFINNEEVSQILKGRNNKSPRAQHQYANSNSYNFQQNRQNSQQRIKYFRGQNILNNNSNMYQNKDESAIQQSVQSKLTEFNANDFINNLQAARQKKIIKLY